MRGCSWRFPIFVLPVLGICLASCSAEKPAPAPLPADAGFLGSIEPAAGNGSTLILTAHLSMPVVHKISEARVLLSPAIDGRNACYVYFTTPGNSFLLIDDSGLASHKPVAGANLVENSQCALDISRSSGQANRNIVAITLALRFKPAFVGKKQMFLYAGTTDGVNSGLTPSGTWNVTF